MKNVLIDSDDVATPTIIGSKSSDNVTQEDAECPHVYSLTIRHPIITMPQDLRCHVLRSTTHSARPPILGLGPMNGESKVYKHKVSIRSNHHVLHLKISVYEILIMHDFDGHQDLTCIEMNLLLSECQPLVTSLMVTRRSVLHEVATSDELHQEIQRLIVLKC